MKVVNTEADLNNKSRHNYLLNKNSSTKIFYINDQKSKSMPATQIITVSKELNSILNKWLRHNTTGHLLIKLNKKHKGLDTNRFEPMTKNYLTKYLNRLFAPTGSTNISSQMLRKIYDSETHGATMAGLDALKEDAMLMGHTTATAMKHYIKKT